MKKKNVVIAMILFATLLNLFLFQQCSGGFSQQELQRPFINFTAEEACRRPVQKFKPKEVSSGRIIERVSSIAVDDLQQYLHESPSSSASPQKLAYPSQKKRLMIYWDANCSSEEAFELNSFSWKTVFSSLVSLPNEKIKIDSIEPLHLPPYNLLPLTEALERHPCFLSLRENPVAYPFISKVHGSSVPPDKSTSSTLVTEKVIPFNSSTPDPLLREQGYYETLRFVRNVHSLNANDILQRVMNPTNGLLAQKAPIVAVVDDGVDFYHEDLFPQALKQAGTPICFNVLTNQMDPNCGISPVQHGTTIAGLLGARGFNNRGIHGLYGYPDLKMLSLRVFSDDFTTDSNAVMAGVIKAIELGATIINLSLGGTGRTPPEHLQIFKSLSREHDVILLIAAGNDGRNLTCRTNNDCVTPMDIASNPEVAALSVGSIDMVSGNLSTFSNFNPNFVDILAPGATNSDPNNTVGLFTTTINGEFSAYGNNIPGNDGGPITGTSFAAPFVTAATALARGIVESRNIAVDGRKLKRFMLKAAEQNPGYQNFSRNGSWLNMERFWAILNAETGIVNETTPRSQAGGNIEIQVHPISQFVRDSSDLFLNVELTQSSTVFTSFEWYFNDQLIGRTEVPFLIVKDFKPQNDGNYYAKIISGINSKITNQARVHYVDCSRR